MKFYPDEMRRSFDERDTFFSRMIELSPGSKKYDDYYRKNPEKETGDKILREHPAGVFSDREEQKMIEGMFDLLKDLRPLAGHGYSNTPDSGFKERAKKPGSAIELENAGMNNLHKLDKFAVSMGAVCYGCTRTSPEFLYTKRGRGNWYGEKVENALPNTFIFAVEMNKDEINRAPAVEESVEVVKGYYKAAEIGLALKYYINSRGFMAVCHMDGESEIIMPPAAQAAGLGSIGLSGLLINRDYGPRIRLAAVSTDMPLAYSEKSTFSILDICRSCGKCSRLCPSGAIPVFDELNPEYGPIIEHEKCFKTWKELGTDCGVCLAACPFSQKGPEMMMNEDKNSILLKNYLYNK